MDTKNLIAELEFELISTSKLLDLLPADNLTWQPHPRAMSLGQLAFHVASIPGRYLTFGKEGSTTLDNLLHHHEPKTRKEILEAFENSKSKAKDLLNNANGNWASNSWNLTKDGSVVFNLPYPMFVRLLVFNHLVHHRGQLSAYLRPLGIPIPSIYGPSGDENPFI